MPRTQRHFRLPGKAVIALLLVGLVLLLDAMAACPALHELIHKDAGSDEHQCVVTFFAHGKVDAVSAEVSPVGLVVSINPTPQLEFSVFTPFIENLPAGRGPPISRSIA